MTKTFALALILAAAAAVAQADGRAPRAGGAVTTAGRDRSGAPPAAERRRHRQRLAQRERRDADPAPPARRWPRPERGRGDGKISKSKYTEGRPVRRVRGAGRWGEKGPFAGERPLSRRLQAATQAWSQRRRASRALPSAPDRGYPRGEVRTEPATPPPWPAAAFDLGNVRTPCRAGTRNSANWMLSEAIEALARAERMHRQFFQPARGARRAALLGAAGRRAGDRARGAGLVALPGVDPEHVEAAIEDGAAGRRRPPDPAARAAHGGHPPPGAAAGAVRTPRPAARRPLCGAPRRASYGCLVFSLAKLDRGGDAMKLLGKRRAGAPAARAAPQGTSARVPLPERCADHRAGAQHGAVPRHRRAGRARPAERRSRPPSRRCASSARSASSCSATRREDDPGAGRPAPHRHRRQHRALHHRARRHAITSSARACSASASSSSCRRAVPGRARLPHPGAGEPARRRSRRASCTSAAGAGGAAAPAAGAAGAGRRRAGDRPRRPRSPTSRRLHGHQAGGEAGDPGDHRPRRAHGEGLAAAGPAHRGAAPVATRSAGRPRRRSTSASARWCCASRWRRSSASSARATARPRRSPSSTRRSPRPACPRRSRSRRARSCAARAHAGGGRPSTA